MCSCNKFISDSTKQEITMPFSSWKPNRSREHICEKNVVYTRITRTIYHFDPTSTAGKPKSLSNKRHQQEVNELKRRGETCKWQTTEHPQCAFGLLWERDKTMWNVCIWNGQLPLLFPEEQCYILCYVMLRWVTEHGHCGVCNILFL